MGQKTTFLAVGLIVFTVILIILFAVTRVIGEPSKKVKNEVKIETTNTPNIVSVNDIIRTPVVYNGYNLEVNSNISGWTTNKSFYFSSQGSGILGSSARGLLLAVAREPFQLPQDQNDEKLGLGEINQVIIKGKVEILNKEQLQSLLGQSLEDPTVTLNNDIIAKWNLGPVLLIDTVEVTTTK